VSGPAVASAPGPQPTLQALLDEAVRLARRHFRVIFLPIAAPLAFLAALMPVAQMVFMKDFATPGRTPRPEQMLASFLPLLAVGVLIGLVWALGYAALQAAATDATAGRPVSMAAVWRRVVQPRFIGTQILAGLGMLAGFCLCFFPGVYLALVWGVVVPVMVEEGRYWTRAMERSSQLLRHNPQGGLGNDPRFKVFLILLVGVVLQYAASFAVQLPFVVVQQVMMFRSVSSGQRVDPGQLFEQMAWINVPSQALGMLVQTAVQLYVAFGLALLFFDARARKEGGDLEAAIAAIAPPAPPAP
jgi:hypothetical protein